MFGFDGSSATARTPRGEQPVNGAGLETSFRSPVQLATLAEPLWMKLQVWPPFVVLYRPHLAAPGTGRVTPVQQTDDMPRRAVVEPTSIVFGSPGLITIAPMPLP